MGSLREHMSDPTRRQAMIEDAIRVTDAEVSERGGITGMAIKAAYAMTKGIAPGFVHKIVDHLMDDFLDALQPFHDEAKQKGVGLRALLDQRRAEAANALLSITDQRAAAEDGGALKKGYEKLRPAAQKNVEQAVPRLADLITKYAP
jgi:hypothetical protein